MRHGRWIDLDRFASPMAHFSSTLFMEPSSSKPSLLERLSALLTREPEDREELLSLLHAAHDRNLFDADALAIIEGALQVSDMQVRDVMVPRAQMDVVCLDDSVEDITRFAIGAAHSRFPVIGENKDDVLGVLLAKDLLRVFAGEAFNLREMLRPAVFVPESKRLNVLLRDFRVSRNHMAIVVDEYGGVAGLVTIEDVLEQIVGDIEDEYDFDETADNIRLDQAGRYRVKAGTEIEDFNEAFATTFSDAEYDTVGGLLIRKLGRLPKRNEVIDLAGLRFQVLRADSRRVHSVLVERAPDPEAIGG
jgi:magnesium and cobalt transporter